MSKSCTMYAALIAVQAVCIAVVVRGESAIERPAILLLLESEEQRTSHSDFIGDLDTYFTVDLKLVDDTEIKLKNFDKYLYRGIVLLGTSVQVFGSKLKTVDFVDFVDNGRGNIFIAASASVGQPVRDVAYEFGVEFEEPGRVVIDHFNYDAALDSGTHTVIEASDFDMDLQPFVKAGKVLYQGVAMKLPTPTAENFHSSIGILTASQSAYSYKPDKRITAKPRLIGNQAVLVAGIQTENDGRIVLTGSVDMLSNRFFAAKNFDNAEASANLVKWTFGLAGVLRAVAVNHYLDGGLSKLPPTIGTYTIKDDVVYTIDVEEVHCELDQCQWRPYDVQSASHPFQLEFVRMDPFVRVNLQLTRPGRFVAKFKIPDTIGVYQFQVDYKHRGFSRLRSVTQFPVRPLRHDQYERFIPAAYPYYASAFSMMIGVTAFSVVYLHYPS